MRVSTTHQERKLRRISTMSCPSAVLLLSMVVICSLVNTANTFSYGSAVRRSSFSGGMTFLASSTSDEDEIKALYAKAQQEDAEWLRRVFDENTSPLPASTPSNDNKEVLSEEKASSDTIDTKEMKILFGLGYSPVDVENIKDSVLTVIIDKAVNRPKKGLPQSWLKANASSDMDQASNAENRRPPTRPNPATNRNMRQMSPKDGVGEAFAWSGRPPTREEEQRGRKLREEDLRNRQNRREGKWGDGEEDARSWARDRREWLDDRENDGPTPFWPDADEFKNMLIDESQWRAGIIGGWAKPFIKAETKWRFKLYKSWLQFLDEGLGDGFDVVADGFQDYYDEEYADGDGDDEEAETRGGDREGGSEGGTTRSARMSKADAYDEWVKSRIGAEGEWVDTTSEERRARAEMRAAVARRERAEVEEENRGRRTGRGVGRRDFEGDDYDDPEEEERREQWSRGSWLDDSNGSYERDEREERGARRSRGEGETSLRAGRDRDSQRAPRSQSNRAVDDSSVPPRTRGRELDINSEEEYRQAWQRSATRAPIPANDLDLP